MLFAVKILALLVLLIAVALALAERAGGCVVMVLLVVTAFLMCAMKDTEERRRTIRCIRKRMKKRSPVSQEVFERAFNREHLASAYRIRESVAEFFGIEAEKIAPDDVLWSDLWPGAFGALAGNAAAKAFPELCDRFKQSASGELHPKLTDKVGRCAIVHFSNVSEKMNFGEFVNAMVLFEEKNRDKLLFTWKDYIGSEEVADTSENK